MTSNVRQYAIIYRPPTPPTPPRRLHPTTYGTFSPYPKHFTFCTVSRFSMFVNNRFKDILYCPKYARNPNMVTFWQILEALSATLRLIFTSTRYPIVWCDLSQCLERVWTVKTSEKLFWQFLMTPSNNVLLSRNFGEFTKYINKLKNNIKTLRPPSLFTSTSEPFSARSTAVHYSNFKTKKHVYKHRVVLNCFDGFF